MRIDWAACFGCAMGILLCLVFWAGVGIAAYTWYINR